MRNLEENTTKDATDPIVAEAQIDAALASGNLFWIYTKDPNIQAFTDLMNRALDKPAEQKKLTGSDDGFVEVIYQWKS